GWSDAAYGKVEDQIDKQSVRTVFNGYLIEVMMGQIAKGGALRDLADSKLQGQIDQQEKQLTDISKGFPSYSKETTQKLSALQQAQKELATGLTQIANRVDTVSSDVTKLSSDMAFVHEFMFGKMTPEEQLSALKGGKLPWITGKERDDLQQ